MAIKQLTFITPNKVLEVLKRGKEKSLDIKQLALHKINTEQGIADPEWDYPDTDPILKKTG